MEYDFFVGIFHSLNAYVWLSFFGRVHLCLGVFFGESSFMSGCLFGESSFSCNFGVVCLGVFLGRVQFLEMFCQRF